ncbi:MAG: hypothetical protein GY795_17160 [Desulfobacterales bacterium]|nr:hypothetical protein [Desulfobacterales bacterium]
MSKKLTDLFILFMIIAIIASIAIPNYIAYSRRGYSNTPDNYCAIKNYIPLFIIWAFFVGIVTIITAIYIQGSINDRKKHKSEEKTDLAVTQKIQKITWGITLITLIPALLVVWFILILGIIKFTEAIVPEDRLPITLNEESEFEIISYGNALGHCEKIQISPEGAN